MAPVSPIPSKRSAPSDEDDELATEPPTKRICVQPSPSQSPQPEEALVPNFLDRERFDDKPRTLMLRSIALALEHVGFDGATRQALGAMCDKVETYAEHFLIQVTAAMLNSRRSETTPLDFEYALAQFDLPVASLEPHLKNPIPKTKLDIELEMEPVEEQKSTSDVLLLGKELSGEPDRLAKSYIPTRFPSFPSKHTYKWTEKESSRETDPRKIREEAAKSARQGEEALRRLNKVSKAAQEKDVKRAAQKDPKSKQRHELWEATMEDVLAGKPQISAGKPVKDEDHSLIVNSDRQYFRKGAAGKKRSAPLADTLPVTF